MDEFEIIYKCPICRFSRFKSLKKETELIQSTPGTNVVECLYCKFKFLNPQRTYSYEKQYFENYKQKSEMFGGSYKLAEYLKQRLKKVEGIIGQGRLLEIGFGEGFFLNYAKNTGWEVYGIDISKWAVEEAKSKFGLSNLYYGSLHEANFESSFFDFIHMNHVLEHIPNLIDTLRELKRILKPKGLLIVEVPNEFDSLQEKLRELIGIKRKPYEIPSPHLWFFTPRTIKSLFKKYGFKIDKIKTVRRNKELSSKYIGGALIKQFIYFIEEVFYCGPIIELLATKE